MPEYDLLIRGAMPLPEIGIANGVLAGFEAASAREEIDASGLLVLPGAIDAHVHFNEPGRTEWEGWRTGSRAAAAGGVTVVCDMPLNSAPPLVTVEAFHAKREAAEAQAICDFALWGGLIPGHVEDLDPLAAAGVMGFKAFMAHSGIDDFPKADLATLRAGMARAARLRLPVAVHAEFDRPRVGTGTSVREYLASRPVASECEAIAAAIDIAGETGCALHVVHVSSGRGVALIAAARARGVDVTAETCPHYLVFTEEDMERLGAMAKCAPPLREAAEREALRDHVRAGRVATIGSDHSPSPWTLKAHDDFFRVWGGMAGIQHLLPLLLSADPGVALAPALVARLTAEQVAARFRLPGKGRLAAGFDADLTLVDLGHRDDSHQHRDNSGPSRDNSAPSRDDNGPSRAASVGQRENSGRRREITAESLFYRHQISAYVGCQLTARVCRTIRRGQTVFVDDQITADGGGRLLLPQPHAL